MIIGKEKPGQLVNFDFTTHDHNNRYFLCLNRINNVEIIEKPHCTWVLNQLNSQIKPPRFKISGILYKPSYIIHRKLSTTQIYFNLLATGETNSFPLTQVIVKFLSREYARIAETNF